MVPFVIEEVFNQHTLEKALDDFDLGRITVVEFHRQLALAVFIF